MGRGALAKLGQWRHLGERRRLGINREQIFE
jgi:hypothetical protein